MPLTSLEARAGDGSAELGKTPMRVDGRVPAKARAKLEQDFEAAFDRAGIAVESSKDGGDCKDPGCYAEVASSLEVEWLVSLQLSVKSRDYNVRATLHDAQGAVVAEVQESCEICGLDEVAGVMESVASRVAAEIQSATSGEAPRIRITSDPSGAKVRVDGRVVGETPYEGEVDDGTHVVGVYLPGHIAVEREMEMTSGVLSTADFELTPSTARAVNPKHRVWGGVSLGLGIAMAGAGIGLLAVRPTQYDKKCSGSDVDADGDCRFMFDMRWGGAALLGAGAIAATIGTMLLVRNKKDPESRVQALIGPTGAGVRGSF